MKIWPQRERRPQHQRENKRPMLRATAAVTPGPQAALDGCAVGPAHQPRPASAPGVEFCAATIVESGCTDASEEPSQTVDQECLSARRSSVVREAIRVRRFLMQG